MPPWRTTSTQPVIVTIFGKKVTWRAALWVAVLGLATGCASQVPDLSKPHAAGDVRELTVPVDLRYRPCRLVFVHTIHVEESDNAVSAGQGPRLARRYRRTTHGSIAATVSGTGLAWHLEVTRMEVDGQTVSHRRAPLTTCTFISDNVGHKRDWQTRLPAYEETGAIRLFSAGRLAGLETDARHLSQDLVPARLARVERSGDKLQYLNDPALEALLRQAGIEALPDGLAPLALAVDGVKTFGGRELLSASLHRRFEFDTQKPFRHHRLAIEARYLVDAGSGLPVAAYNHYALQSTHLSYTRNRRLWKKTTYEPR
jgi:hypothetical protein